MISLDKKNRITNKLFLTAIKAEVVFTIVILLLIIGYISLRGIFKGGNIKNGINLSFEYLFTPTHDSGKTGGIIAIVFNTFVLVLLVALIASPIGIGSAIWLSNDSRSKHLKQIVKSFIEVLASIPSIIFGLFGMIVFVGLFNLGYSLISGVLTLTIMVLPTIISTSENAIKGVDNNLILASIGLGATKAETIFKVTLKMCKRGMLSGVILAIGRAIGETAALIYTVGSSCEVATSLTSSARPLAMHIYLGINEGQSFDKSFQGAFVLMIMLLLINTISRKLMRINKN